MSQAGAPAPQWQRLHPLTPVVSGGRAIIVLVVVGAEEVTERQQGAEDIALLIILGVLLTASVMSSVVRYFVTKWALDGPTLRIETGLFRRDARQFPLVRIQAVDVVRPFLARAVGLAELRVRLAGSGRSGGRLAYLSEAVAVDLRARLIAGHHGLDLSTPEPAQRPMATVPIGQLVASAALSSFTAFAIGWIALVVLLTLSSSAGPATAGAGTLALTLIAFGRAIWRRVATQYGFSVGLAPDGIRIQRGLLSTVSETVPFARVQAVRKIEPLLWRLFGWCRLEVDVAGSPGEEQGTRSSRVTKALLPVGKGAVADELFSRLLGLRQFKLAKPPHRAFWKSPLSYHFLAAGWDGGVVAATTGRVRKVTVWLPLEKVQSVRWAQGPLQRALRLATVHVDAAGRRATAELRDRGVDEAASLFDRIVVQSRLVRHRVAERATRQAISSQKPVEPVAQPALSGQVPSGFQMGQPLPPPAPANGAARGP